MEYGMKIRNLTATFIALILLEATGPNAVVAQEGTTTWDDLQLSKSSRSQRIFLLPGADFRPYHKVMFDPTEVAFRKNWMRDYNSSSGTISRRVDQGYMDRVSQEISSGFGELLADEYQKAGYQIVQSAGPDVLRIRTGVIDLSVSAPDVRSAGRSKTFSREAGEATLVVEARDSLSGALMGRALDKRVAGDRMPYLRNRATNRMDFKILLRKWAKGSAEGLNRLKNGVPVAVAQK
jgi:hypothetical protein